MTLALNKRDENVHLFSENKSIGTLMQEIGSYRIILPKFQRDYQWNKNMISNLVNSLVIGIPIPPIYLHRISNTNKTFEILDGQQRLFGLYLYYNSIFFSKENRLKDGTVSYRLKKLPVIDTDNYSEEIERLTKKYETMELDKLLFHEIMKYNNEDKEFEKTKYRYKSENISEDITYENFNFENKIDFLNASIPVVYITSDEKFSKQVFETINSTSIGLKDQQLRDCKYFELFNEFYERLDEIKVIKNNIRTYSMIEDTFEILIKYNLIKDSNFFEGVGINFKTQKQTLLDKCSEYLFENEEKKIMLINDLDKFIKLKDLKIDDYSKMTRTAIIILTLIFDYKVDGKLKREIRVVEQLIKFPKQIRDDIFKKEIENNSIDFKKLELYLNSKYSSKEEAILKYYIDRLGENNE